MAEQDSIVSGMAGRYAMALFELARDAKSVDQVSAHLQAFGKLVDDSADLRRMVRSPVFTAEEQGKALGAILGKAGITGLAANFLKLVASKRRLFAVQRMISDFGKLVDAHKGIARAEVTVAHPLADAQLKSVKDALATVSGGKQVEVDVKVDPAIIGGIVVRLGSRMVDSSLKTKLNSIRSRMKEVG